MTGPQSAPPPPGRRPLAPLIVGVSAFLFLGVFAVSKVAALGPRVPTELDGLGERPGLMLLEAYAPPTMPEPEQAAPVHALAAWPAAYEPFDDYAASEPVAETYAYEPLPIEAPPRVICRSCEEPRERSGPVPALSEKAPPVRFFAAGGPVPEFADHYAIHNEAKAPEPDKEIAMEPDARVYDPAQAEPVDVAELSPDLRGPQD